MENYIKKEKTRRIKTYVTNVIICILIVIIIALSYVLYTGIDVNTGENLSKQPVTASRLSQTIEQEKEEEKTITKVIEQVNESIVGISKLKEAGNTIFTQNGSSQVGLGTGMIVAENGYILTNEHVSGAKYSNCYVTLPNGKSYQANVVWSDSNIDLSIVKINAKNLPYVSF